MDAGEMTSKVRMHSVHACGLSLDDIETCMTIVAMMQRRFTARAADAVGVKG